MITTTSTHRPQQTRRSLVTISVALAILLAVYFYTQVLNGAHYRTISDSNQATQSPGR